MNRELDITPGQHSLILTLLKQYVPDTPIWAYGSRVTQTSRTASDLDLVAFATSEQAGQIASLKEAFEESNLPFRIDLFVWHEMPEAFRKTIEVEHMVLQ